MNLPAKTSDAHLAVRPPLGVIEVLVLSQATCVYCDAAKGVLETLSQSYPLAIREIDIASDEGRLLATEHGVLFAPGILFNNKLASYGRPSQRRLRRILNGLNTEATK